jgi:predicted enzyme related to lactoylglutathione lyase
LVSSDTKTSGLSIRPKVSLAHLKGYVLRILNRNLVLAKPADKRFIHNKQKVKEQTMPLPRLSDLSLNVRDPKTLAAFYCDVFGMHRLETEEAVAVGYENDDVSLVFQSCDAPESYRHSPVDRYWKIAITLPDLDVAFTQLRGRGIKVTAPHQFRNIAYMSHLTDPAGHVIELLQHSFKGNAKTQAGDPTLPLGGGARIGLITLRTDDIEGEFHSCSDKLGMRYLSRQDVSDLDFCLHFLAFTNEMPPDPDINAIANREWLWQRPYTVLEFQEVKATTIRSPVEAIPGAAMIRLLTSDGLDHFFR